MSYREDINRLKLFNEKANHLLNTRFVQYILSKGKISFQIEAKKGEAVKIKKEVPNQDAIEAFILTFRYFIQNNEQCSFGNLSKTYERQFVPEEIRKEYLRVRKQLNDYLDAPSSSIKIETDGETPTRRRILDIFIYGGLAHANPKKKEIFDKWMRNPIMGPLLKFCFVSILIKVLEVIRYVVGLNEKLLKKLEK